MRRPGGGAQRRLSSCLTRSNSVLLKLFTVAHPKLFILATVHKQYVSPQRVRGTQAKRKPLLRCQEIIHFPLKQHLE